MSSNIHTNLTFETFWKTIWLTESRAMQAIVGISTLIISIFIGLAFADFAIVRIYPLALWLFAILICFAALYRFKGGALIQYNYALMGVIALTVVAFYLRFASLESVPLGFHTDESGAVEFALNQVFNPEVSPETINPLRTGQSSQPVLFSYLLRFSIFLFGATISGARTINVFIGALAVPAVFLMVHEIHGRRVAWTSAILMTFYHAQIHWSRIALNNIWTNLLLPLTLGFFLLGWRKRSSRGAVWAGFFLGLSAYFYAGGYIVAILLAILIIQNWKQTNDQIGFLIYTGKTLALAATIAAPLIVFAILNPRDFFERSRIVYAWRPENIEVAMGDTSASWSYLKHQISLSFGAFNYYPDNPGFYAPGIPFLIGIASVLFVIGLCWTIYKRQYFVSVWILIVTLLGGVLTSYPPASSHYVSAFPAICWLVAVPIDWLFENNHPAWAWILLTAIILTDLVFYFIIYSHAPSPDLVLPFPKILVN